uniref:Butyrophilin subfamily 1 member A1-like n=1 Tax=Chelydra serpentina TaxID=8475 RepID=A0A8C3T3H5_CHESE
MKTIQLPSVTFKVIGPDHPITASVGEDALLPCHLSPSMSAQEMEVRWFRSKFSEPVHLYQNGKDQADQQIPDYQGRTELLKEGIVNGSVVLRIRNISPSDYGQFNCFFRSRNFYEDAVLELKVAEVKVTLDPETAHPRLKLSDDKTTVTWESKHQALPDNPERFDQVFCVLGSEGFSSGRIYWEVEGMGRIWAIGVARESVRRKGPISFTPEEGIWGIEQSRNCYSLLTTPECPLPMSESPVKVRIYVHYEKEEVAFFNPDNADRIATLTASFRGEKIFPFFWVCGSVGGRGGDNP